MRATIRRNRDRVARGRAGAETLAKQAQRENTAGGAVVDRQAMERVEADYRVAIANARRRRDVALQGAGEDRAARARAMQRYERAQTDAMQQRAARREVILGR